MKSIKAVISDLDGTLLNASHVLSERTKKVIQKIEAKNILFVIATGRHFMDVLQLKDKMGANPYIVTANGALVLDRNNEIIYQSVIPKDIVKALLEIEVPDVVYKNIYQDDLWLMNRKSDVFDDYYVDENGFNYTLCDFETRYDHETNKVFFTSKVPEALIPIYHQINEQYSDFVDTTFSLPQVLEVMAKGTNKGRALDFLLGRLGIESDHCIAFGDGLNDKEMLDYVGQGYIMANGDPNLKSALPHLEIIGSNKDDAVAQHVESLLFQGE